MNESMISAAVTMGQIQKGINTVANNMSNMGTTGYKSRDVSFADLLVQNNTGQPDKKGGPGRMTPLGIRIGSGARVGDTQLNMAQGSLKKTDRMLDFALTNPGQFFTIEYDKQDGTKEAHYTRNGAFYLSPDQDNAGTMSLVTADGHYVLDRSAERITVPRGMQEILADPDGRLTFKMADGTEVQGPTIAIADVKKPQLFKAFGENEYVLPDINQLGIPMADVATLAIPGETGLQQRSLEASNVDMTEQMTTLMNMQRSYQLNARAISTSDDMLGLINRLR